MDRAQVISLYDQFERREIEFPDLRREVTPNVVRHIATSDNGEGMILYSQLNAYDVEETIREQVRYFESLGQDFEWKLFDYDEPADLRERLEAYGFTVEDAEALVVLDLENAPKNLWDPIHHDVRRITDAQKLVDIQMIEEAVWNEDSSWVVDFLGTALSCYPEQMSIYVAYVDDQPASAAWIYFPQNSLFASLWGGSTIERYRNRGLYTALLAVRAQEAKDRQVKYLTVDASSMSRPILEKFGFEVMAWSYPCKWEHHDKSKAST
jgi:GNAT superfamily N-acetyltransferase